MNLFGSHDWLPNMKHVSSRTGMTTLILEKEPAVSKVAVDDRHLTVHLVDGRVLVVPLGWYPRLVQGSACERGNWLLLGDGDVIEWPELDEHIGIEGLLAGRHSGESKKSFERWLSSRSRPKRRS